MKKILIFIFVILFQLYSPKRNLKNPKKNKDLKLDEEENKSDDIIIIHTNDVHCGIMDSIGYDGLMLYKKELLKKYKYVLTVDVGDHIQGDVIGLLSKGLDIISIMNKIGYNISTIGNHEFDYGIDSLKECAKNLECGYISANFCYRKNKSSIFPPYKILTVGNKKIAFIGIITPQTLTSSYLHNIVDNEGMVYDFLSENNGQLLYDTVQNYIDKLRANNIDYIIIIDHMGDEGGPSYQYTSSFLLSNISGVDALLDAHTHKIYNKTGLDKEGNSIPLAQTGTKLSHIGVLKIKTTGEIISEIIDEVQEPEDKNGAKKIPRNGKEIWVDEDMNNFLINISNSYSGEIDNKIGYTDFDLIINTEPNKDHHKHATRGEETTLGNLITDAYRDIANVDIAITNGASIRGDLLRGNITFKNILNILPYGNEIVIKEILGKDILDALEVSVKFLPEKSPKFLQVSGISFKVNMKIKSSVEIDEDGMFKKVKGERRVYDVKVGNEKIDLNKSYSVCMTDYMSEGGDGYSIFKKYQESMTTSKIDQAIFKIYIIENLNGVIPEKYQKKEGRIKIIYKDDDKDNDWILTLILSCLFLATISATIFILYIMKMEKNSLDDQLLKYEIEES